MSCRFTVVFIDDNGKKTFFFDIIARFETFESFEIITLELEVLHSTRFTGMDLLCNRCSIIDKQFCSVWDTRWNVPSIFDRLYDTLTLFDFGTAFIWKIVLPFNAPAHPCEFVWLGHFVLS